MLLRKSAWLASVVLLLASTAVNGIAESQTTTNNKKDPNKQWAVVNGFRTAKFGMDEKQVLKAVFKDFKVSELMVKREVHRTHKTVVLSFLVPNLIAFGGAAHISYVMGYESKKLNRVVVHWGRIVTNKFPEHKVLASDLMATSNTLRHHFLKKRYKKDSLAVNYKVNDKQMVLFRGRDEKKRMLILELASDKSKKKDAQSKVNNISLKLSYIENPDILDIYDASKD
jgi:hypothetical protein